MSSLNAFDALRAENVSLQIGQSKIVRNASLTLEPGKTTALLGNSGAGKSTLLRLFAGLEKPSSGEIWLGQTCLSSPDTMVRAEERRTGLIFQDFALFPHLSLLGNVQFGLTNMDKLQAREIALDWLARVGLESRADDYPHQLSGGEQQRVAIVRALATSPLAILMDEPFSGLDPALREEVRSSAMTIIKDAGIPALLVTHDAHEAMALADQLCIMREGRIVQSGTPEEVYTNPIDKAAALALGPVISLDAVWNANNAVFDTVMGPVNLAVDASGRPTKIYLRPEGIYPDPSSLVDVEIQAIKRTAAICMATVARDGHIVDILLPSHIDARVGSRLSVGIDSRLCFIF